MRRMSVTRAAALALAVSGLAACTVETNPEVITVTVSPEPTTEIVTPPSLPTSAVPETLPPAAPAPSPSGAPISIGQPVPMPDVVCMNLQLAQDTIQAAGVFYSRSVDATGAGRMQIVDRNWVVVSQRPAPGIDVGEGEAVLSVVRDTEPNQC